MRFFFNPQFREITEYVLWEAFVEGARDAHGNKVDSWEDPVEKGIYAFDPGSTSEPREPGADRVTVDPTLYMPKDVVFGPHDRVTVRGLPYTVEGVTREWPTKGNVVSLRRGTG